LKLRPSIRSINDLRNKLAHDLKFKVSAKAVKDLGNCTPKGLRESVSGLEGMKGKSPKLLDLLIVNLMNLETMRQRHVLDRLAVRHGRLRLQRELEKTEPYLRRIRK
jgi:hypothetical protein